MRQADFFLITVADVIVLLRYATEVDVDFVRKSVRAIGRCAIKVEPAAERCVSTLLDLIQTKVNYVVQEAIVVLKVSSVSWPIKNSHVINVMNTVHPICSLHTVI